jgi:ornithine carbamoyltransferase
LAEVSTGTPIASLRGRSFVSAADVDAGEAEALLARARELKGELKAAGRHERPALPGRTVAMIFEKPSLRTRVTFETGMTQLGGHAIYLAPADIRLGQRESVADVAANLGRWVDGVVARTFSHEVITELAANAGVPVVNALSDLEHPCQALADYLTVLEHVGRLRGVQLVFVGDGNNVWHSLALLGATLGVHMRLAAPAGYAGDDSVLRRAREIGSSTGARVEVVDDAHAAVSDADIVYTDVWASMGQEDQAADRARNFAAYQVNAALLAGAPDAALVMHCLPAHRGEEITSDVLDGPRSIVLDQAENRLHAQKALLEAVLA